MQSTPGGEWLQPQKIISYPSWDPTSNESEGPGNKYRKARARIDCYGRIRSDMIGVEPPQFEAQRSLFESKNRSPGKPWIIIPLRIFQAQWSSGQKRGTYVTSHSKCSIGRFLFSSNYNPKDSKLKLSRWSVENHDGNREGLRLSLTPKSVETHLCMLSPAAIGCHLQVKYLHTWLHVDVRKWKFLTLSWIYSTSRWTRDGVNWIFEIWRSSQFGSIPRSIYYLGSINLGQLCVRWFFAPLHLTLLILECQCKIKL